MSHARKARDATSELRKEGATVITLHFVTLPSFAPIKLILRSRTLTGDQLAFEASIFDTSCCVWRLPEMLV